MKPKILIADDDPVSQFILGDLVSAQGYEVILADDGDQAWDLIRSTPDLHVAFIDWVMPGIDGPTLCAKIKAEIVDRYVYAIMITAKDLKDDLIHGMEAGADEFISKPVHEGELISRLRAGERMLNYERRLRAEMQRSEDLLTNIMPASIANRLKAGEQYIADFYPCATLLFLDVVGFTDWCQQIDALAMVEQLNSLFAVFDAEINTLGLEKIKSIGDAYMVASGVPNPRPDHAQAMCKLALRIQKGLIDLNKSRLHPWRIRTGITSGPVVAGVIGQKRFIFDVWGDTVNNASRLEHAATTDQILVGEATYSLVANQFEFEALPPVELKGIGTQNVWRLVAERAS
jgi:adenylate cyclase